jgi:hypothetical protein
MVCLLSMCCFFLLFFWFLFFYVGREVKTGVTMNQLEKIHQKALVSGNVPKIDPQYKQDPIYRKNHNVFFGTEPTESW